MQFNIIALQYMNPYFMKVFFMIIFYIWSSLTDRNGMEKILETPLLIMQCKLHPAVININLK